LPVDVPLTRVQEMASPPKELVFAGDSALSIAGSGLATTPG